MHASDPSGPAMLKYYGSDILSFTEAPLTDPTTTPPNTPETDPKRTRNGPGTDPKRSQTEPKGAEMDRNQALSGGTAGGVFVGMGRGGGCKGKRISLYYGESRKISSCFRAGFGQNDFFSSETKGPGERGALRNHPEISSQKLADFECRFPYDSHGRDRAPFWPFLETFVLLLIFADFCF